MNNTLVASSRNRRVPSSLTRARSTEGWASKSKSASRHGAGSEANRVEAGVAAGFGGGDLDVEEPFEERGVAELVLWRRGRARPGSASAAAARRR